MLMFTRLKALRDQLAAVPSSLCDAETRRQIVGAIDDLDDAMVMDTRAQEWARNNPASAVHEDALALFAGTSTASCEVAS